MKYNGQGKDVKSRSNKIGVLLINLGTPGSPTTSKLRKYLSEFLMDPRVIELPKLLRTILVKGIIINFRSHKSARTYQKIWTENGSPLLVNSQLLAQRTDELLGEGFELELAMRYGNPSIKSKLKKLHQRGVESLVVIPLYPQYSGSTNGSAFDEVTSQLRSHRWVPSLSFINSYYQRKDYISAIANSIRKHWNINGRAQKLVMSFHGLPQKFISNGDPYLYQCEYTAKQIAEQLKLNDEEWLLVFQSRFGAEKWIQPYCDETLKKLPSQGVTSVDIVCPGFSADCLETLEEIDSENRDYFIKAGGVNYSYIPCLNNNLDHAKLIASIVHENS